jgi:hypothetical protein
MVISKRGRGRLSGCPVPFGHDRGFDGRHQLPLHSNGAGPDGGPAFGTTKTRDSSVAFEMPAEGAGFITVNLTGTKNGANVQITGSLQLRVTSHEALD